MQGTDVAIVGGGFAGSLCAAMLGRAGIDAVLIDPNPIYPPEFRCEKLDGPQLETLQLTGLADAVVRVATPDRESWVARFGHVVDKRPGDQLGIMYDTLVNTVRAQIPSRTPLIEAKAIDIITGPDRQLIKLSNGDEIEARLVVLANGLNITMQQKLGITRRVISARHSISIGFDVRPVDRPMFSFPALTYYAERPSERMALITLFPIGTTMRANLFAYRDARDPWFEALRDAPERTLAELWPNLRQIMGEFSVSKPIKLRPVDLYVTDGYQRDGLVMIGDAFATSCPAAGTGARKALVDAERLCNVHIPAWLATPGMQQAKIATFYRDPIKQASDISSQAKAFDLREFSTNPSLTWTAKRVVKFVLHAGRGHLRQVRKLFASPAGTGGYPQPAPVTARQPVADRQVRS